ncbi:non-specific serine/threonine protein kinase [Malassezia sp. CBS 17886]|nr:non-specific serine/threonine protein kinase [Malassezia sp. CBS 17886]
MADGEEREALQRTEREVLSSILGSDFRVLPATVWHGAGAVHVHTYEIVLRPEEDVQKAHVAVVVHIVVTRTYPATAAVVHVRASDPRTMGMSAAQLKELGAALTAHARTLLGTEMVWELVSYAQEYISKHNTASVSTSKLSLEEEMRQRAESEHANEQRRSELERQRQSEEARRASEALAQRIESATRGQREAIRAERRRLRDAPIAPAHAPAPSRASMQRDDAKALSIHEVHLGAGGGMAAGSEPAGGQDGAPMHPHDAAGDTAPAPRPLRLRRGPLVDADRLSRVYLATAADQDTDALWTLELTPITSPYYAGAAGQKKMDELGGELTRLAHVDAPSLVRVVGWTRVPLDPPGSKASVLCIVQERSSAWRMSQLLAQCQTLPWARVRAHLLRILDALTVLHREQLVHRDVSLDHLLFDGDQVRVAHAAYRRRLSDMHKSNALNGLDLEDAAVSDAW